MEDYSESSIKVLEGTEGVRLRPAMYIGDVGARGLHHLVYEVIDNSIDEAMAGRCSKVDVIIHEDNSVSLKDDGAGIPAGMHPEYGVPTLEIILTKLHSGGKFEKKAYQVSGGLHGIGLAAVCALSSYFRVESFREDKIYIQEYSAGVKTSEVQERPNDTGDTGTLIHFKPDEEIFNVKEFNFNTLAGRFRELAYLTSEFRINFTDARQSIEETEITELPEGSFVDKDGILTVSYFYEGGLRKFVEDLIGERELLIEDQPIYFAEGEAEGVKVECAFGYTTHDNIELKGFVNNINTTEGGTHLTGFRRALTKEINDYAVEETSIIKEDNKFDGTDIREGIVAIVSVKVPEPQFEGQTKTKLGNSEVDGIVSGVVSTGLRDFLFKHRNYAKAIVQKAEDSRTARLAARKAREQAKAKSRGRVTLPGKLVRSNENDPTKRELFIVEGQSAGGTAADGRDKDYQEILFMKGKVLNVEKAKVQRALSNDEINSIITAVGTNFLDEFDLSKIRYGKIILLADADQDGYHIATLLLTFFYRYMKPIIEGGYLYIARPPLHKVKMRRKDANALGFDNKTEYLYNEDAKNEVLEKIKNLDLDRSKFTFSRFKGLGEMNASQLKETTMNPQTRRIDRVTIQDVVESEDWLIRLMGDDVSSRKRLIQVSDFAKERGADTSDYKHRPGAFYKLTTKDKVETEDDFDDDEEDMEFMKEDQEDEYDPGEDMINALQGLDVFDD